MTGLSSVQFDLDILARSSIVHREDYSALGSDTFGLFRREKIITPDGAVAIVPIVSGSSFRGVLRRIGEQLTAAALGYEGQLSVPAAHLLSNGGRLAKTDRPMSDEGERRLKELLPQVAVFGGAASGRILSGLLSVGKVLPEIAELAHLLPRPAESTLPAAAMATAEETFSHRADHRPALENAPVLDSSDKTSPLGKYSVETLPAGIRLQSWARLINATDSQVGFFAEVLAVFATRGHLGGRIAAGHGAVSAAITPTVLRGHLPSPVTRLWAEDLAEHHDEVIRILTEIS